MILDERNNEEEKFHIRELPEQLYMEMLDEKDNENKNEKEEILIREIPKQVYNKKMMLD